MICTKDKIKQGKKIIILHGDYSRTSQIKGLEQFFQFIIHL